MKEVKPEDVIAFFKANYLKVISRGAISFVFVIVAFALYFAIAPRSEAYRSEIQVTLESREGSRVYPNGEMFGLHDIISAPVLTRLWTKYDFDKKGVEFEDFAAWFSIVGYDKERTKIDAEFQGMMSKRNVTATELAKIQAEYEAKLAALADNRFALTIKPGKALDRDTAVRILNDIPKLWFEEYATIKAPQIPAVSSADSIRAYVKRSAESGGLALGVFDVIDEYMVQLDGTCRYLRDDLMRGRNTMVEGVDLGAYESQLLILHTELLGLKNEILKGSADAELYNSVKSRIDDLICQKSDIEGQIKAVQDMLEMVLDKRPDNYQGSSLSDRDSTPVTLQADSGFFNAFTSMIRRDADSKMKLAQGYFNRLSSLRVRMANLTARKLYYEQIIACMSENIASGHSTLVSDANKKSLEAFTDELIKVGEKVVEFRDYSLKNYRTPDQFFVVAATPAYSKSFTFSIARFALAALALWFLYNLIALLKLWNR